MYDIYIFWLREGHTLYYNVIKFTHENRYPINKDTRSHTVILRLLQSLSSPLEVLIGGPSIIDINLHKPET